MISDKDITVRLIVPEARKPRTIRNSGPSKPKTHDDYNYEAEVFDDYRLENSAPSGYFSMVIGQPQAARQSRRPYIDDYDMGKPFSDYLFELIDKREMSDAEVYKRANMDRRHFSKIRNSDYHPSKKTALALAIALKLDVYQTNDLLEKAGYILSRSSLTDQIVRKNIEQRNFDINDINIELFDNGQASLG
ncbi:MAG: hypothetical protein II712_02345 [Erysipelotrichaceae bacterium]|nr:hypothetical protein [Erysipelotrichaceae bacterium]